MGARARAGIDKSGFRFSSATTFASVATSPEISDCIVDEEEGADTVRMPSLGLMLI